MMLNLIQSFLAAPAGTASPEERQVWEDFYHSHDPMIHAAIRASHEGWNVVDDLTRKVWCVLIERLPNLPFDYRSHRAPRDVQCAGRRAGSSRPAGR
jgi:hypothetical protein